jgi:hypothetical protein
LAETTVGEGPPKPDQPQDSRQQLGFQERDAVTQMVICPRLEEDAERRGFTRFSEMVVDEFLFFDFLAGVLLLDLLTPLVFRENAGTWWVSENELRNSYTNGS